MLLKRKGFMRVCVLIDAWYPLWGGGQTHAFELYTALTTHYALECDIYTRRFSYKGIIYENSNSFSNKKVHIYRSGVVGDFFSLWHRVLWNITVLFAIIKKHKRLKYDLIHAHAYFGILPAIVLKHILKVPLVVTVHGSNNLELQNPSLSYYLEKILLTHIKYDRQITVSKSFLKYKNINNATYIPNGIRANFLRVKTSSNKKTGRFKMLWLGRVEYVKGIDILIASIHILKDRIRGITLDIIGDGSMKNELIRASSNLGLSSIIHFKPALSYEETIRAYVGRDLFVLSSRSEGMPITILEALATGVPVVATKVGDLEQIVKQKINGMLVPTNNAIKLAEAIEYMYNHPMSIKQKVLIQKSMRKYSWEEVAKKTYTVYLTLLRNTR